MKWPVLPKSLDWQVPASSERIDKAHPWPSLRVGRILLGVVWVAVAAGTAFVCWAAWRIHNPPPPAPPPPPLDFEIVVQRFPAVQDRRSSMTRDGVEAMLGPPTRTSARDGEVIDPRLPRATRWHVWIDPEDQDRWVAVLYDRRYDFFVSQTKVRGVTFPQKAP
jgi:hypothetical protein